MLNILRRRFFSAETMEHARDCMKRLAVLDQKAASDLQQLFSKTLSQLTFPRNRLRPQTMDIAEQFTDYYMSTEQLIEFDLMVHLRMVQVINILFDNKSKRYNPTGSFYYNYHILITRLMRNIDQFNPEHYSTALFAAARFKYADFFEYAPALVRKAEQELPHNDMQVKKSIIYSLAKFGLISKRLEEICLQMLKNPRDLERKLLLNLVLYLSQARVCGADYFRENPMVEQQLLRDIDVTSIKFYFERVAQVFARMNYHDSPFLLDYLQRWPQDFAGLLAYFGSLINRGAEDPLTVKLAALTGIKSIDELALHKAKHNEKYEMYEKSWTSVRHEKITMLLSNSMPLEKFEQEKTLGIFVIDIFLPRLKAVLEVDGPSHFFRRVEEHNKDVIFPSLNTSFKHESLEKMGYKVLCLKNFMPTCEYLDQLQELIIRSREGQAQ